MIRDSVVDWQELSALYEHADALDGVALAAWLTQLRSENHRLLPQLERMLDARAHVATGGFLEVLPTLESKPPPFASEWCEGTRLGAYRLIRHIGSGGMAEVWLAERADGAFERQVAIKLLFNHPSRAEQQSFAERFKRERDILASLHHPNIAALHDAGVTPEGQPWLALEYVEGRSITAWCDEHRMPVRERIAVFRQALLAVQHAHTNLVIHRDLKPANILVTGEGQVRLLDFGIAKLLDPEGGALGDSELTRQAGRLLTLQYASPEQILGQPLTTTCDVYSLGVVLYELICGERPYELNFTSSAQVEQAIVGVEPRAPSRRRLAAHAAELRGTTSNGLVKTLSRDLDAIVCKCLSKHAGARYPSVEAFSSDLDRLAHGRPVAAKPSTTFERSVKFFRRHRLATLSTASATMALVTLTVLALAMSIKAHDESARAIAARDFVVEMFRVADPDRTKGTEPTARHILENASDRAVVDLKDQPVLLASVLEIVAQMQGNLGLFTVTDTTLSRLAALYERLGKRRELAATQTSRALNAYQLGDDARAQALVDQAAAAAAPFPHDHELQAKLVLAKGWIARGAGKYVQAREEMTAAMAQSALAFGPNHIQTIEAMRGLAEVEAELGHHDEALRLLTEASTRAEGDASADERYRLEVSIARANALLRAGQFVEAAAASGHLMPTCERLSGKHNSDCDFLRRLWVVALLRSGPPESALPMADDLIAAGANSSAPILQAVSITTAVRLLAENHRLAAHPELKAQLADIGGATTRPTTYRVQALLTLAEADLLSGAYDGAEHWTRAAMALLETGAVPLRGRAKVTLALSLARQGHPEEALTLLNSAELDLKRDFGPAHPLCILYGLNRAVFLQRFRHVSEAVAAVDTALPTMRTAFGAASPVVKRIEALRSDWLRPAQTQPESARPADMFF